MLSDKKMIRFFTFAQVHGKFPVPGSTQIRVNQLMKYWPNTALYKYGENPDVLIFQKVYTTADYKFPAHFQGIKILDICDPDWFSGQQVRETIDAMDAVVCPTMPLVEFLKQLTDKPVIQIKDRFDLEELPSPKSHSLPAKRVVWFGYRHNAITLKPALDMLVKHNINLTIIADDDPLMYTFAPSLKEGYRYIKHTADIYADLQACDFALLPKGFRPEDRFKSENKTVKANLAGLPVANDIESFELFLDGKERQKWVDENYARIKDEYDVKRSVEEYQELIKKVSGNSVNVKSKGKP